MSARLLPFHIRRAGLTAGMLLAALLAACEGPTGGTPDGGDRDTLHADPGKDKLNRYDFLQGKFLATGRPMDLAIEGKGFFILKSREGREGHVYYRRPAAFSQDAEGYLHLGNPRTRLRGMRLSSDRDPYPVLPDAAPVAGLPDLEDVRWPLDDLAPPKATTVVKVAGNLQPDAVGRGSILYSQAFLHHAEGPDLLVAGSDAQGRSLDIASGDVLTFSATANGSPVHAEMRIVSTTSFGDLAQALMVFLRGAAVGAGSGTTADLVTAPDSRSLRGAITVYGNTAPIRDLRITRDRPASGPLLVGALALPPVIPAGTMRLSQATEPLRAPAQPEDRMADAYDAEGNELGLSAGDAIAFSGSIGKDQAGTVPDLVVSAGTTLAALLDKVRETFRLPARDGTADNHLSVSLNPAGSDDGIPDGTVVIRGAPGTASAIRDVSIRATDGDNRKPSPNFFNTNMNITTLRSAGDAPIGESETDIFDASGRAHRLTLRLIPTPVPGSWLWEAEVEGAALIGAAGGSLRFGADGRVAEWPGKTLVFDPGQGIGQVTLALDSEDLTQVRGATAVVLGYQDGFPAGRLLSVAIGEDGLITGTYANGKTRPLFRLPLADFPNHAGLEQVGADAFLETPESGKAVIRIGRDPAGGTLRAGEVEYASEAELARVCEWVPACPP